VVKCLPRKLEVLNSNPSAGRKEGKEGGMKEER
jgi:hypothetical protein